MERKEEGGVGVRYGVCVGHTGMPIEKHTIQVTSIERVVPPVFVML